jgi:hypothetical protein
VSIQFPKPGAGRQGTVQNVAYSTAATLGAVFGVETYLVRLCANSACHYLISGGNGAAATAATVANGSFLPANWVEVVAVTPGMTLSVIQAATNGLVTATAGTLNVTELA